MPDRISLRSESMILGETFDYRVRLQEEKNADLSAVTATLEIWDSAGGATLAPQGMTVTGTTRAIVTYAITSGGGANITAAGDYRVIVKITRGGKPRMAEGLLTVKARPF